MNLKHTLECTVAPSTPITKSNQGSLVITCIAGFSKKIYIVIGSKSFSKHGNELEAHSRVQSFPCTQICGQLYAVY